MSSAKFEKPCAAASPFAAIERAVRYLLKEGYGLEEQSNEKATLVFVRGSKSSLQLDQHRHHLEIAADGESLHFNFFTNTGSSGYLTKREGAKLDKRATATAEAAADPPPPPAPEVDPASCFRCRYCNALTPVDTPNCSHCGAANFT